MMENNWRNHASSAVQHCLPEVAWGPQRDGMSLTIILLGTHMKFSPGRNLVKSCGNWLVFGRP